MNGATEVSSDVIILNADTKKEAETAGILRRHGYTVSQVTTESEAHHLLRRGGIALLILAGDFLAREGNPLDRVRTAARRFGIPVLEVLDVGLDPNTLVARHGEVDDWIFRPSMLAELPARVARLIARRSKAVGPIRGANWMPVDDRFLALVVHDLRTPLNVIGLSLRMIDHALPKGDPDIEEDLRFIEDNFKQLERMLSQLSDYCRLFENEAPLIVAEFSPGRMMADLVEDRSQFARAGSPEVRLDVLESCPAEAELDQGRARLAIQYVLANAAASSNDKPIQVTLRGGPDRWVTEVVIDHPPPPSVKSVPLSPARFERLCGTSAERRGMDLAIAARVSELFGGTARLDVVEDRCTAVVLDWPTRLKSA